jgi:glutamate carboxypeptidase
MARLYDLQNFCRANANWLIETIESLVRIESPSDDKSAVDRCGAELAARLAAMGGRVTRLPQTTRGDHLRAEFDVGPRTRELANPRTGEPANPRTREPQVLLLGHFDTVWPVGTLERMPLVHRDGRLHGPGVFDMKAGIGIAMLATRALLETGAAPARRIVMLWTTDEEVGSQTSRHVIEEEARKSDAVFVLEPSLPGGAAKTARKGVGEYELHVHGIPAHAGIDPSKGASAIHELARQILRLEALHDLDRGVSVTVGRVSGGTRTNVVAEDADAVIDVRATTAADAARLDDALRRLTPVDPRTTLTITGGIDRPPLERTPEVVRLYQVARGVAAELGLSLEEGATGGGSDGNFTAAAGVSTLDGIGAVGDGAHALHEHVEVAVLPDRAALVAGVMARVE